MSALFATRQARRRAVTYVALLATSLVLMATSANPFVQDLQHGIAFGFKPIEQTIGSFAQDVRSIGGAFSDINSIRIENDALRQENDQLKVEKQVADELRQENDQLTSLLQLRRGMTFNTLAATVIARDSSEARRIITIDRGSNDGLQPGYVVVAAGGALAGRISDVGPDFAHVVLISDTSSIVIGQLLSSQATGPVQGQLSQPFVMQNVDTTVAIQFGEEVFTAGIELSGGIRSPYPKGLLIGTVIDAKHDPNEVVQTVFIDPAVNLDQLEYVLVITDYQGGLTGPLGSLSPCLPGASGALPGSDQPCTEGPSPTP
ncbi:MAG TPA: rod shape-determining protein MreC [Candidatus Limnocylindrales bacterium]|nr:rod shape-determining protein MreC [Candidatus Limnocylindrales bacterium]